MGKSNELNSFKNIKETYDARVEECGSITDQARKELEINGKLTEETIAKLVQDKRNCIFDATTALQWARAELANNAKNAENHDVRSVREAQKDASGDSAEAHYRRKEARQNAANKHRQALASN